MRTLQLFVGLFIGTISATLAQTSVLPYTPGVTAEGVVYYLPQTELSITITATCTTKTPGELNAYAGRYLKINDAIKEKQTSWVIDDIKVTPFGAPDTTKVYSIPLKKGTIAPLVSLTRSGLILSINTNAEEKPLPQDPGTNKTTTNALNSKNYLSQEILYAGSASKMAELTANEIYDLRESRTELSKGEADNMPKDGEQLKLMIQQLNLQEEALLQLFTGTEEKTTKSFTITYKPAKSVKKEILFRFSDQLGVVDKDNLAGEPVYIDVTDQHSVPSEQPNPKKKKTDEQAVRYNVASDAAVKIYSRATKYCDFVSPVAQFGKVEILSNELFNKRTSTQVLFNQETGTLKQVTEEGEAR